MVGIVNAGEYGRAVHETWLRRQLIDVGETVLNNAFGEPTIAVDTHIFRVANRTGLAPGKDVVAVEQGLLRVTPPMFRSHAHHWLILHGRYVCKARKPECWRCIEADLCAFIPKTPPPKARLPGELKP